MISFCVAFLGIVAVQAIVVPIPSTPPVYEQFLNYPPFYTGCNLPWSSYWDLSEVETLNAIALDYGIRMSDVAQWNALISKNCPTASYESISNMLNGFASEFKSELNFRDICFLPSNLYCNALISQTPAEIKVATTALAPEVVPYYKNMLSVMDRMMPQLSGSTIKDIRSLVYSNLPAECLAAAEELSSEIAMNMRYDIGMAAKNTKDLYYPYL